MPCNSRRHGGGAASPTDDRGGVNRRRWMQLMGASMALAAAGGCRWEAQDILPFAKRPDGRTPGMFKQYSTAMPRGDSVVGLEVTCVDGRPIKVEGNPRHPMSLGASDAYAQAAILQLYDPDRSESVKLRSGDKIERSDWKAFDETCKSLFRRFGETGGEGFRVLAEPDSSPTLTALRTRLLEALPKAKWFEYEPLGDDNFRAGSVFAFGRPLRTQLMLDRARVIVCLDADLLNDHPASLRYARDFAARRDPDGPWMNRLYAIESGVSLTGAAADHRLPLPPSGLVEFAARLEDVLANPAASADPFIKAVAADLLAPENRGQSIVCAGPSQPPEVHAAVHRINAMLGNAREEATMYYTALPEAERPSSVESIRALTAEMNDGRVAALLILGGNPVYDAPADLKFSETLDRVETSIRLSLYEDETSRRCAWRLPQAHFLESWGDGLAFDGTYGVIQPMIAPLRNGRSSLEVLAAILAAVKQTDTVGEPLQLVRQTFDDLFGKAAPWERVVRDGVLADSRWPSESVTPSGRGASEQSVPMQSMGTRGESSEQSVPMQSMGTSKGLEAIFRRGRSVFDGRYANNGWLQELPDPVTKLTWGNAASIAPATAAEWGIENEDVASLKIGDRSIEIPIYVLPGQAPGTVELSLGYGRRAAGVVGGYAPEIETVGVDVYPLRTTETMHAAFGASIEPTGRKFRLAGTQDHFDIDALGRHAVEERSRILIRQETLPDYRAHPEFAREAVHHPPLKSLWEDSVGAGHRWAMSIDLSKCVGCGACIAACQAENNIPVVGREQVLMGREMHWIRVDRYFQGAPDNPELVWQPLPCQQCELAPCEQVCPVAATVHSSEGLNDMVYNRCVGTRYCANNCPFKVRRFNFFNHHKELDEPANEIAKMKYNPQVTIRSRGVMEKCTYCVQRIQEAKIAAKVSGEQIPDGRIRTACQQACPAGAIAFGDLADPGSEVSRLHDSPRSYALLAELNIRPRTLYLARIRNPNPKLSNKTKN